jgi:hypothetical protein
MIRSTPGFKTLVRYILLSVLIKYLIHLSIVHSGDVLYTCLLIIAPVLSVILWHVGIKEGIEKSIKEGIVASLYFIIPYGLSSSLIYLFFSHNQDTYDGIILILFHHILSYPMAEFLYLTNVAISHFYTLLPLFVVITILIFNIVIKILKSNKEQLIDL